MQSRSRSRKSCCSLRGRLRPISKGSSTEGAITLSLRPVPTFPHSTALVSLRPRWRRCSGDAPPGRSLAYTRVEAMVPLIPLVSCRCQLALRGPADPSGRGEGYSYTRLTQAEKAEKARAKTGTDGGAPSTDSVVELPYATGGLHVGTQADFRKMKLSDCIKWLAPHGYTKEQVVRWSRPCRGGTRALTTWPGCVM